ncbi:uncharacterized protein LOC118196418 [Stegodyphus dumicola]|uniref:uncharacterized protein LOC118196418 n=1 Tax=Stegodyphus dumicola TaxID=202533 RepID=UPI0015AECDDD|nr:uncharacterized protein LOC118196418 [Stegodyphus dumicola]
MQVKSLLCFLISCMCSSTIFCKGDGRTQNWMPDTQNWPQKGQTKGAPLGGWDDEVANPWKGGADSGWRLEDTIPGVPGQSYPNFDKIPETSFDCRDQQGPGYYGDVESHCQVFHICQAGGRQNTFLCPVGTLFNQEMFVCDWWFNVNCAETSMHYGRNTNLFRSPQIGIDGSKIAVSRMQISSKGSANPPKVGIPTWDSQSKAGGNWDGRSQSPQQHGTSKGSNWSQSPQQSTGQQQGIRKGGSWPQSHQQRMRQQQGTGKGSGWQKMPRQQQATGKSWPQSSGQQQGVQKGAGWSQGGNRRIAGQKTTPPRKASLKGDMWQGGSQAPLPNSGWGNRMPKKGNTIKSQKGIASSQGLHGTLRTSTNQGFKEHNRNPGQQQRSNIRSGTFGSSNKGQVNSLQRTASSAAFKANSWSIGSENFQNPNRDGWFHQSPNIAFQDARGPDSKLWQDDGAHFSGDIQRGPDFKGGNPNTNGRYASAEAIGNFVEYSANEPNALNNFGEEDYGQRRQNLLPDSEETWKGDTLHNSNYDYDYGWNG